MFKRKVYVYTNISTWRRMCLCDNQINGGKGSFMQIWIDEDKTQNIPDRNMNKNRDKEVVQYGVLFRNGKFADNWDQAWPSSFGPNESLPMQALLECLSHGAAERVVWRTQVSKWGPWGQGVETDNLGMYRICFPALSLDLVGSHQYHLSPLC